jgi:predicted transcriptional regulator
MQFDHDAAMQSYRRSLIEKGLLVLDDGGYSLTQEGLQKVQKELEKYELRPEMAVLIQTHVLTANGYSSW